MVKINSKQLAKRVKEKAKPLKANVTFRFDIETMEKFKKACKEQKVKPTAVLEELMGLFVSDLKSGR